MMQTQYDSEFRGTARMQESGQQDCNFRRLLSDALKNHDRREIAGELTERVGTPVTATFLNECTRSTNGGRGVKFPACWVAALCEILGEDGLALSLLSETRLRDLKVARALKGMRKEVEVVLEILDRIDGKARGKDAAAGKSRKRI
jgi:hypothetical protein